MRRTRHHRRVIPRDLFNESKLLKCLGQLALHAHDGTTGRGLLKHRIDFQLRAAVMGFIVMQDPADGGLYVDNLEFFCHGHRLRFKSGLNAMAPYPLTLESADLGPVEVLRDDGSLADEFLAHLDELAAKRKDGP